MRPTIAGVCIGPSIFVARYRSSRLLLLRDCARLGTPPVRGGTRHQDAVPLAGTGRYGWEFVSGACPGEAQTRPIGGSACSWAEWLLWLGQGVAEWASLLGGARGIVGFDEDGRTSGGAVEGITAECG